MSVTGKKLLLVGDNPFHGISHLSDDRARARGKEIYDSNFASKLVQISLENGADGFMFSVSEMTLSILRAIPNGNNKQPPLLYAIIPYAYEYVRLATNLGTVGLAKELAKQIVLSANLKAVGAGVKSIATMDPKDILKAYFFYEISRIKSAAGKKFTLESVMLHEVITEMILGLNLDWLAKSYVKYSLGLGVKPGFETRNFAYLIQKFKEWNINLDKIIVTSAFNDVGFQMNPSKAACQEALSRAPEANVIAMSILASGYLKLPEAAEYIQSLSNLKGVVVGVSNEQQAFETFKFLGEKLKSKLI
ncbi:MAG: hypothetical protein A2W30_03175 [Ignavibacteria bacterium RBG_16_36_9]|nr:MAG: hypothetical protein A2W30_03175 [Ignavibacteria bacterium RBG_16_36_9]